MIKNRKNDHRRTAAMAVAAFAHTLEKCDVPYSTLLTCLEVLSTEFDDMKILPIQQAFKDALWVIKRDLDDPKFRRGSK